jgi:hypothetical protein
MIRGQWCIPTQKEEGAAMAKPFAKCPQTKKSDCKTVKQWTPQKSNPVYHNKMSQLKK